MTGQFFNDTNSVLAPLTGSFAVTPSGDDLTQTTRAIMVDTDDATITGKLLDDDAAHTTVTLKTGILYPFRFLTITAVSAGSVIGYY